MSWKAWKKTRQESRLAMRQGKAVCDGRPAFPVRLALFSSAEVEADNLLAEHILEDHRVVGHRIHKAGVDHSQERLGWHQGREAVAAAAVVAGDNRVASRIGWEYSPMEGHCRLPAKEVPGHSRLRRMSPEEVQGEEHGPHLLSRPWCRRNGRWHLA